MWFVLLWLLVILAVWVFNARGERSDGERAGSSAQPPRAGRRRGETLVWGGWTLPALQSELERIERLLLEGDAAHAGESLSQIEPSVMKLQGPDGALARARFRLAAADFFGWTGRPVPARAQLDQAGTELDAIGDPALALALRARGEAALSLLEGGDGPDPDQVAAARRALAREPEIARPEVLMRLAWVAHRLAMVEHVQGHWPSARELFERSVAIGLRLEQPGTTMPDNAWDTATRELFWTHGRRVASDAARDLGLVLGSLGDREGAMHWLDLAVTLMEGARLPAARLRLARALIDRANHEPVDAFTGTGRHEALLQRARDEGLACGTLEGKTAACVAEVSWSKLYEPPGPAEKRIEHLEAAMSLTADMPEPAAGYNITFLHLSTGAALEELGERAAALESLQRAVDRGRAHADPDSRKLAAQAAYRLHQLLLEDRRVADGRAQVEVIEELVPSLGPEARTAFAGIAAHARGMQHCAEEHLDDARRSLEQAEGLARQAGASHLARAAAADLGRVALRMSRPADAEPHLRRALEISVAGESAGEEHARRAEILWLLSDAHMMMELPEKALSECRRAYDLGRTAGNAAGREVAAVMAFRLGEADEELAERRRLFRTASQLGRLSGRPQGREAAEAADARLQDMAE